tara:strand:+ start:1132 stop:1374 length:243 start_codon:yes stop_codon:yes gene_type:complete
MQLIERSGEECAPESVVSGDEVAPSVSLQAFGGRESPKEESPDRGQGCGECAGSKWERWNRSEIAITDLAGSSLKFRLRK